MGALWHQRVALPLAGMQGDKSILCACPPVWTTLYESLISPVRSGCKANVTSALERCYRLEGARCSFLKCLCLCASPTSSHQHRSGLALQCGLCGGVKLLGRAIQAVGAWAAALCCVLCRSAAEGESSSGGGRFLPSG